MKKNQAPSRLAAALAIMLVASIRLEAQTAAVPTPPDSTSDTPSSSSETVVLSPFEVSDTAASKSYGAKTTLAGNRLSTDLRDIGSSLTVVTSQLLSDTGATDNTTLLQRIGGAEVGGINGNFASPGPGSSGSLLTEDTIRPTEATRIRGLAAADNARDFFISDIPWDSYNTDRIDIQRGPNAILFGEGSPAGIINSASNQAEFRNFGDVDIRFGNYSSNRWSLDLNQQLVPGQVAVRLDLLRNNQYFEQDPAYNKDQRISGAIRIEPAFLNKNGNRTIIKANIESGRVDSDNPRDLPPTDHITPFFNPADAGAYQAGLNGLNSWTSGLPAGYIASAANGYAGAGRAGNSNTDPWFTNSTPINQNFALVAFQNGNTVGSGGQYRFTSYPQSGQAAGLVWPYGAFPGAWLAINGAGGEAVYAGLPYANGGLFSDTSITNPSIFNFYKNLIDGNMKSEWQHFWQGSASFTQTFLNDQVGFDADYNKQHYEYGQVNPLGGAVPLYIEVMSTNNDGTSLANASPNPNYGRPYVYNNDTGTNFNEVNDREDERGTAFVTHDFKKDGPDWWRKILGVQTLTGMVDQAKLNTQSMNWQQYGYLGANTALAASLDGNAPSGGNFATVSPQQVIYLGPSLVGKSATGANIPRVTGSPTIGNQSINYFDFTPNPNSTTTDPTNPAYYNGWTGQQTLSVTNSEANPSVNRNLLATSDSITRSVTTSQALVYEGKWLDDAIVGIYGWRRDINKSWADNATLGDPNDLQAINFNNIGYSQNPQGRVAVQSRSYSLVAHLGELPYIKNVANQLPFDVSLAYSSSSNFQPDSSRVNINGDAIAPPSGKTIERGIAISSRNGRYALKINRYVTNIQNGSNPQGTEFAAELASWVGFNAYYGNVFYYHNNQAYGINQSDAAQMNPSPGISAGDSGTVGAAGNNGSSGAGWYFDANNYHTQAMETLQNASTNATRAWETQINGDFPGFFKAWGMGSLAAVQSGSDFRSQLQGLPGETNFAITENSLSKGWELEFDANPINQLRLTANATETNAVITAVGDPALAKFMAETASYIKGVGGSQQWFWGQDIAPSVPDAAQAFYTQYVLGGVPALGTYYAELQQQQGVAAQQMAKWRYNVTANWDFDKSFLKGVNVGGGIRFTDKEIIGYPPGGDPTAPPPYLPDLSKPEYSPSETYFDLWVGYTRTLFKGVKWNIQLNISNVGRGNYLIPVSYQAPVNGVAQPAFYRIGPSQQWTLKNVISF